MRENQHTMPGLIDAPKASPNAQPSNAPLAWLGAIAVTTLLAPSANAAESFNAGHIANAVEFPLFAPPHANHNLFEFTPGRLLLTAPSRPFPERLDNAFTVTLAPQPPVPDLTPIMPNGYSTPATKPPSAVPLSVDELQPRRLRAGSTGEFIIQGQGFTRRTDVEFTKPTPDVAISEIEFIDSDTLKVTIKASEKTPTRVFNFNVRDPQRGGDKLAPGLIVVHVPQAR